MCPVLKRSYITVQNTRVSLKIWDFAGQERLQPYNRAYFAGSDAVVVVYDITDMESFQSLNSWMRDVNQYAEPSIIYLIGNKVDKNAERTVQRKDGEDFADCHAVDYFMETSATTGTDVDDIFHGIADKLMQKRLEHQEVVSRVVSSRLSGPSNGDANNLQSMEVAIYRTNEIQATSGYSVAWKSAAISLAIGVLTFTSIEVLLPFLAPRLLTPSMISILKKYWTIRGSKDAFIVSGLAAQLCQMDPVQIRNIITHVFDALTRRNSAISTT